jgi:hypothetical protein
VSTSQFDPKLACVRGSDGLDISMVFKAQPMGDAVPHLCLAATQDFPDPVGLIEARQLHVADATTVVDALFASLPGGTLDQILRLMLERRASYLVVRF